MKTTFVKLNEEDVKSLKSLISGTEKRTMDREFVLREIRKDLKSSNAELAKVIDANWKRFLELQAFRMPHVVYNGHSMPAICDWVKDSENFKLEKAIKSYRYADDEEETVVEGCFNGRIVRTKEEAVKETITYASGFQKEVASVDENGDPIIQEVEVTLVPKEKSAWGFTNVMVDAFISAVDDLLEELV